MISYKIKKPVNSDVYGFLVGFDTYSAEKEGFAPLVLNNDNIPLK
jgi:hypothetical protein